MIALRHVVKFGYCITLRQPDQLADLLARAERGDTLHTVNDEWKGDSEMITRIVEEQYERGGFVPVE